MPEAGMAMNSDGTPSNDDGSIMLDWTAGTDDQHGTSCAGDEVGGANAVDLDLHQRL